MHPLNPTAGKSMQTDLDSLCLGQSALQYCMTNILPPPSSLCMLRFSGPGAGCSVPEEQAMVPGRGAGEAGPEVLQDRVQGGQSPGPQDDVPGSPRQVDVTPRARHEHVQHAQRRRHVGRCAARCSPLAALGDCRDRRSRSGGWLAESASRHF